MIAPLLTQAGYKKSYSLYPNTKLDENVFVNSLTTISMTIIKNISLPLKLLTRTNFGDRYFSVFDYLFYLVLMTIGAIVALPYIIGLPVLILTNGFNAKQPWIEYPLYLPIIYPVFIFYIAFVLWRRFKTEINGSSLKSLRHSNYPGDTKLSIFSKKGLEKITEEEQDHIREVLEPKLCITAGLLIMLIDPLMGTYLLLMSFSLKVENWYIQNERRNNVLDIIDSIYDGKWSEHIFEMVKDCHDQKLPVEQAYDKLLKSINSTSRNEFQKSQSVGNEASKLSGRLDYQTIDKLLKHK